MKKVYPLGLKKIDTLKSAFKDYFEKRKLEYGTIKIGKWETILARKSLTIAVLIRLRLTGEDLMVRTVKGAAINFSPKSSRGIRIAKVAGFILLLIFTGVIPIAIVILILWFIGRKEINQLEEGVIHVIQEVMEY